MAGRWYRAEITFRDPLGDFPALELIGDMPDQLDDDRFAAYHQSRFAERIQTQKEWCERLIRETCGLEPTAVIQWRYDEKGRTWSKPHTLGDTIAEDAEVQRLMDMMLTNISYCTPREEPLWFAAKFLAHLERIDHFEERGQTRAKDREIYLLGQTWAQAALLVNHGIRGVKGGQSTGGRARKRRGWAELAADWLAKREARTPALARAMVPEGQPLELDEDHAIYLDGERLCCIDLVAGGEVGSMSWGNFAKRYLGKKSPA